jgi:POT family proton-dependent oligopeptide transporter
VGTIFLLWNACLTCVLTSSLARGWAWSIEDAMAYGTYTMSVYFTPVIGGFLADRYLGYRWAVLGALAATFSHASMA